MSSLQDKKVKLIHSLDIDANNRQVNDQMLKKTNNTKLIEA